MKAFPALLAVTLTLPALAEDPPARDVDGLGDTLTPLGAEKAGYADGSIPAWTGGCQHPRPPDSEERRIEHYEPYASDEPLYTITAENVAQYADMLTVGQKALFERFPDNYRMPLYQSRRGSHAPELIYEATRRNAEKAYLSNGGESLNEAVTGIPFPLPESDKEVIWNHKLRYRGESVRRYNTQLAVQSNGLFTPYRLREEVRFHYNNHGVSVADLDNIGIYVLQTVVGPPRRAGNLLLVHETLDQVRESRRAWLYSAGRRRVSPTTTRARARTGCAPTTSATASTAPSIATPGSWSASAR